MTTKPVYGGSITAEYVVRGVPQMATMRAGAYESATPGAVGRIVPVDVRPVTSRMRVLQEATESGPGGPRLKDARVVVAGGLVVVVSSAQETGFSRQIVAPGAPHSSMASTGFRQR